MSLPFDMIAIEEAGGSRYVTPEGFLALPLDQRIGLILSRKLRFMLGMSVIDTSEALKHLMAANKR